MKRRYVFIASGTSMIPLIKQGDKISVKPVGKQEVRVGDIIVFWDGTKCLVHRVISKDHKKITVKGDNINVLDAQVKYESVVGKVTKIEGESGIIYLENKRNKFMQYLFLLFSKIKLYTSLVSFFSLRVLMVHLITQRK